MDISAHQGSDTGISDHNYSSVTTRMYCGRHSRIMEANGMSGCCHSYRNNDFLHYVFSQVFKDPAERITAVV